MITVFSWLMDRPDDAGDWVRIVLVDSFVVTIATPELPRWVKGWTYGSADDARALALHRTEYWEDRGLVLRAPMHVAQVDVSPNELTMECLEGEKIGPILHSILVALNEGRTL